MYTSFRLVSKWVTLILTLNGMATADARYLCGSWAVCYIYILKRITVCQVVFIIHTFSDTISRVDHSRVRWIFCFGMANSMVNPLIYGAFHLRRRHIGSGKRSVNGSSSSSLSLSSFILTFLTWLLLVPREEHLINIDWRCAYGITYLLTYLLISCHFQWSRPRAMHLLCTGISICRQMYPKPVVHNFLSIHCTCISGLPCSCAAQYTVIRCSNCLMLSVLFNTLNV